LFFPIGQDGVEHENAYTDQGLFFKLGSYNQTNGKSPQVNRVWCSGAETHGGDLQKQYADGNYAEVWFKSANIEISDKAYSNEGYFAANDDLSKKTVYPSQVIPFMDKFKILMGDGSREDNLVDFENKDFFYTVIDGTRRWVVYKTPNAGVTSPNSSNTRTELHEKREWVPEEGGKLTGNCKVMHVSPLNCIIKNSQVMKKDLYSGIMRSILLGKIMREDGISLPLFGVMIWQL